MSAVFFASYILDGWADLERTGITRLIGRDVYNNVPNKIV
jgi:hypothetical protein